jgi:hypothetical protein
MRKYCLRYIRSTLAYDRYRDDITRVKAHDCQNVLAGCY